MNLSLLRTASVDSHFIVRVRSLAEAVNQARSEPTANRRQIAYRRAADRAVRELQVALSGEALDEMVRTPAYWAMMQGGQVALELIDLEIEELYKRLVALARVAEDEIGRWRESGLVVAPDTNIFLHVLTDEIRSTDWFELALGHCSERPRTLTVVVALKVIDELDRQKRNDRVKARARAVLKEINQLLEHDHPVAIGNGQTFDILVPSAHHQPAADADYEIVEQVASIAGLLPGTSEPTLLTSDVGMRARAKLAGLATVYIQSDAR